MTATCSTACRCARSHWRLQGEFPRDAWYWRPGTDGCERDRHDLPGALYWGVCHPPPGSPDADVARHSRGGDGYWYWLVVLNSEPCTGEWVSTETEARHEAAGLATAHGPRPSHRCDLVASDYL